MAKYRKKPEIVDAEQWHKGDDPLPGMEYLGFSEATGRFYGIRQGNSSVWSKVKDAEWVVKDSAGQLHKYSDSEFAAKYEPVDAEAPGR